MSKLEFGFSVIPHFGKILAEVYEISAYSSKHIKTPLHVSVAKKEFGGGFLGFREVTDKDFKDARAWAKDMLTQIHHANK